MHDRYRRENIGVFLLCLIFGIIPFVCIYMSDNSYDHEKTHCGFYGLCARFISYLLFVLMVCMYAPK